MIGPRDLSEPRRTRLLRWSSAAALVLAGHVCGAALATMNWQAYDTPDPADGAVAIELAPMPLSPRLDMPDLAHGPLMEEAKLTPQAAKEVKEEIVRKLPRVEPSPLAPEPQVVLPTPKPVDEKKPEEDQPQEEVLTKDREAQASSVPLDTAPPPVDGKAAPVSAAPSPGLAASAARAHETWTNSLSSHLNRYKRYPPQAQKRRIHGEVNVQFTVDRTGRVVASHILQSSGSRELDEEALAMLQRASPLPRPPELVPAEMLEQILPIKFLIK